MQKEGYLTKLATELRLKGFSEKTVDTYSFFVEKFLFYLEKQGKEPESITKQDLKDYVASNLKGYSRKSSALLISSLNFFNRNLLGKDIKLESLKVERKLPIVLTKEEVRSLIENAQSYKSKIIILLLYSSGLRVSEIVNLKRLDLDFKEKMGKVKSGKGSKDRFFQISNKLIEELNVYFQKTPNFVYVFSKDKPLTPRNIQKIIKTTAEKAKINKKVTPHTLRHSYATHLLESGTNIRYIQTLLGHENLNTTQIYTHVSTESLKKIKNPLDEL